MSTRRRTASLAELLHEILEPPVTEVGALPVDAFVPPRLRGPTDLNRAYRWSLPTL